MKSANDIKIKLRKLWGSYKFHKAWLTDEVSFPFQIKLDKPNNKTLLHQFDEVRTWISDLTHHFTQGSIRIIRKEFNYSSMGKQSLPIAIEFEDIESIARYLGKWQEWQQFCHHYHTIKSTFPVLTGWLKQSPASIQKYNNSWPQLLNICRHFSQHPIPDCYIRELDINAIDTKFIERHKAILKTLLDQILDDSAINLQHDKLSEHGFEKRFGLRYEQPRIRFRLLDQNMASDFSGITDLEIPITQFAQLDLICDRIFITENKTNGLAFPQIKNAIVIFGLGYGIQILKQANWISQCQLYYWGDIDTHGFAILSGVRSHFPQIHSWLMDEETLLHCKEQWGKEPEEKSHQSETFKYLTPSEHTLYNKLKSNYWQESLRLEQEKIPFEWWQTQLKALHP
ncbi:MAG: hypothetical protein GQ546_03105 [Gammaproteobacteria bacterium]|nr:hypothetical protein [Gammaproteobacteria bacterium]